MHAFKEMLEREAIYTLLQLYMGRKNYGNTKLEMASLHSGDLDVVTDGNVLEVASIININLPVCSCCKYRTVRNKQES